MDVDFFWSCDTKRCSMLSLTTLPCLCITLRLLPIELRGTSRRNDRPSLRNKSGHCSGPRTTFTMTMHICSARMGTSYCGHIGFTENHRPSTSAPKVNRRIFEKHHIGSIRKYSKFCVRTFNTLLYDGFMGRIFTKQNNTSHKSET